MVTTVQISSAVVAAINEEVVWHHWREVCGLLFGSPAAITHHQSCRNVSREPERAFEIDPSQLLAAHRAARAGGAQIVGYYHSHPAGPPTPSPRDAALAAPDGMIWLIVAGRGTGVYRAVPHGALHDRFDPVALIVT